MAWKPGLSTYAEAAVAGDQRPPAGGHRRRVPRTPEGSPATADLGEPCAGGAETALAERVFEALSRDVAGAQRMALVIRKEKAGEARRMCLLGGEIEADEDLRQGLVGHL